MKYPESMKTEAIELSRQGYSHRAIARKLVFPSRMTVWRWINGVHDGPGAARKESRERRSVKLPKVEGDGPVYPDIDPDDKDALIERLKLENEILRAVNEVLKAGGLGDLSNREKTLVIDYLRQTSSHRLKELTDFLRISKSSYEYCHAHLNDRDVRDALARDIERIFSQDGDCVRGYRFVHAKLVREQGKPVSEKIVRDVMRQRNLQVIYVKKAKRYSSYKGELDDAPGNLPLLESGAHDFHADAPNERWSTDITEFKLPDAPKVYLSPILDWFDGKPVAWSIGLHPDAELANSSLRRACETLRDGQCPQCHSDRGCHYRWPGWKSICKEYGIVRSMSRKGHSPDNAVTEGFFGRLKNEFFYGRDWKGVSAEEFIGRLDEWMRRYSTERLKVFKEGDGWVYDTIDNRRKRLGWAA